MPLLLSPSAPVLSLLLSSLSSLVELLLLSEILLLLLLFLLLSVFLSSVLVVVSFLVSLLVDSLPDKVRTIFPLTKSVRLLAGKFCEITWPPLPLNVTDNPSLAAAALAWASVSPVKSGTKLYEPLLVL